MPVKHDHSRSRPDIGLVSLPVLCCLLGAALFVYEYGGSEPTLTREFLELEARMQDDGDLAETLASRAAAAAADLRLLAQAARLVRVEQELATLTRRNDALKEESRLLAAWEVQAREMEEARLEATRLREELDTALTATERLFGGYQGEFVLVECVADAIVVHPAGRRIPLAELSARRDTLLREIDRTGYVAIAVRPSGWGDRSFNPVRALIRRHLEAESGIRWTEFPLPSDESIEPYLPRRS
jgi:hypothetical protein